MGGLFSFPGAAAVVRILWTLLLVVPAAPAPADWRLPAEVMEQLPHPWPPPGWSEVLDLPAGRQSLPHHSEHRLGEGYFGQTLYRNGPGRSGYWTANVLIQDRGDRSAAWRAVSAVRRCKVRSHLGNRARECRRGVGRTATKTLHYQVDRFYVTIQVSGPGEIDYPVFEVGRSALPPRL